MKVNNICAAAIVVAILGTSVAGGATAFAVETETAGLGKVIVEQGKVKGEDPIPDPEAPVNPFIPSNPDEVTVNPGEGEIIIQQVTNLDFGKISSGIKEVTKFANSVAVAGGSRGAIVGWSDVRANGAYGYTITAQMSKQFTGTTAANKLAGATIEYSNGFFVAAETNTNVKPAMTNVAFKIGEDNAATTIITADKTLKQGKGSYSLAFGDSRNTTADNSVKLTVPVATASSMVLDTYTANVLWKIVPEVL